MSKGKKKKECKQYILDEMTTQDKQKGTTNQSYEEDEQQTESNTNPNHQLGGKRNGDASSNHNGDRELFQEEQREYQNYNDRRPIVPNQDNEEVPGSNGEIQPGNDQTNVLQRKLKQITAILRRCNPWCFERQQNDDIQNGSGDNTKKEATRLRKMLRLYFNPAFSVKGKKCYFNFFFCFVFLVQVIKVALLSSQMLQFGDERGNFSSVVNRGHLVLRYLLLENWDDSRETLPYPPAIGEFAAYKRNDVESGINYAVKNYYNVETEAMGYYIHTTKDEMTVTMKYFDLPGSNDTNTEEGITISEITLSIDKGLTKEKTKENETIYNYDITRELEHNRLSQQFKRMLSTTLHFNLHSVRSHESNSKASCLSVEGWVNFVDLDNNGQVLVDLVTKTKRIKCKTMNLTLSDWQLEKTSEVTGAFVIVLTILSLVLTTLTFVFGVYTCLKTKQFNFQKYYEHNDDNQQSYLPWTEYLSFLRLLWDVTVILSDNLTLYGTFWIVFYTVHSEWELELLDSYTVAMGVGCLLAWLNLLRFFNFHKKFRLLISTLYRTVFNVIAYLSCVSVLFVGFWLCGYAVMAPYHVKFKTKVTAAETLLSLLIGDEIYTTLAILESDKTGGTSVSWFTRLYIIAYIVIFTIVALNLLIALFASAFESIKEKKREEREEQEEKEKRNYNKIEIALRRVIKERKEGNIIRSAICEIMNESRQLTSEEQSLKQELSKIVSGTENDVVLLNPKTLKAFVKDENLNCTEYKLGPFKCVFLFIPYHEGICKA